MFLYLLPFFILIVFFLMNRLIKEYKISWGETLSLSQAYLVALGLAIIFCVCLYHTVKFVYYLLIF